MISGENILLKRKIRKHAKPPVVTVNFSKFFINTSYTYKVYFLRRYTNEYLSIPSLSQTFSLGWKELGLYCPYCINLFIESGLGCTNLRFLKVKP